MLPQDFTLNACYRSQGDLVVSTTDPANNANATPNFLSAATYPIWNGDGSSFHTCILPNETACTYIPESFAHARLVGASMTVSYIGTAEQESGFMTGSHVYDSVVCGLSEDIIEEGYYTARARPSDGIRLVYQPRDSQDFEFIATDMRIVPQAGVVQYPYSERQGVQGSYQYKPCFILNPEAIVQGGQIQSDEIAETPEYDVQQLSFAPALTGSNVSTNQFIWRTLP